MIEKIDIGRDFSRYPAGRHPADGLYNGETFREKFLKKPLSDSISIELLLDNCISYGSSFLEEAFGGLIRVYGFSESFILDKMKLISDDESLKQEILEYMHDAQVSKDVP